MKPNQEDPKEMVGGCCVCSDENGWTENPLVYCDGEGCNVAVHQACYGIVTVPTGSWFCRKCESQERAARVRCELCPAKDGALKRTDSGGWAHVVCALYIPEVRFGNVTTMEPIMLQLIPPERFNKICYICEESSKGNAKSQMGACMQCNRQGCKNNFHVTCAQAHGLLCEEAGNYLDNVKYCGYCSYHYNKLLTTFSKRGSHVKTIPPYRPVPPEQNSSDDDKKPSSTSNQIVDSSSKDQPINSDLISDSELKDPKHKKRSSKYNPSFESNKLLSREIKPVVSEHARCSKPGLSSIVTEKLEEHSVNSNIKSSVVSSNTAASAIFPNSAASVVFPSSAASAVFPSSAASAVFPSSAASTVSPSSAASAISLSSSITCAKSDLKVVSELIKSSASVITNNKLNCPSDSKLCLQNATVSLEPITVSSVSASSASSCIITTSASIIACSTPITSKVQSNCSNSVSNCHTSSNLTTVTATESKTTCVSTIVSSSTRSKITTSLSLSTSSQENKQILAPDSSSSINMDKDKEKQRKLRRNGSKTSLSKETDVDSQMPVEEESPSKAPVLNICEEKNLSMESKPSKIKLASEELKLNVQFTANVSSQLSNNDNFNVLNSDHCSVEPIKRARSNSQDRGRRNKRGSGGSTSSKRGRTHSREHREHKSSQDSGASSPDSFTTETMPVSKRAKAKKSDCKDILGSVITNGIGVNTLLLGNQINPSSAVAQKMSDTLNNEIEAHSIYKDEEKIITNLIGPALPGKRETSTPGAVLNSSQPPPLPQSLEQLLERQWEQGSQFLMEQAQHFDIASLLSCLHQLRQENVRLEETVNNLVTRRDHLLAVNARLSVPLSANPQSTATVNQLTSVAATTSASMVAITGPPPSIPTSVAPVVGSSPHINANANRNSSHARHPSGGGHPSNQSVRGAGSPHDRKVPAPPHHPSGPLENGLAEAEYRYRSPGADHQHRQQSPMLPPAAQPSPTSMRQSPASANFHSGSSPHTGVPSLSPSGSNHPPSMPSHALVAPHGHGAPVMVSSSHRPDHSRAELVRLTSSSQPPNPEMVRLSSAPQIQNPNYPPVYQMVSPSVSHHSTPVPHHSPVAMPQNPHQHGPPHTQVMRRDAMDSGRGTHSSMEKR